MKRSLTPRIPVALSVLLLAGLPVNGSAQQSNLLAKCIGKPIGDYGKAFFDPFLEKKKSARGVTLLGKYKTGSAELEVSQTPGSPVPNEFVANFYQAPEMTWNQALGLLGLSADGVVARPLNGGRFELSGLKSPSKIKLVGIFERADMKVYKNPSMHLWIHQKRK